MEQQSRWEAVGPAGRRRARVTNYNRLVRDRIPEMIESMGNIAICQDLDNTAFSEALLSTIARAGQQFADSESLESLADLLDALDAWLESRGLSMEEVDHARVERQKRCGGYEQRRFLQMVADGDGGDVWTSRGPEC